MSEPVVLAEDVSKRFRLFKERNTSLKATILRGRRHVVSEEFWALRDVSFDVKEGETFGLIGENGSGKSTMLKCLTRILTPEKGRVAVEGKISALLELGAGFHPELSGRENVFLNGAILGLGQKELKRRFDAIVDFAGIAPFIDEPVKNYSSGMYVRLGFSVAINVDPDVLLVDEVLAVGDEAFQRKCNEKFAQLRNNGKTIVLVSHGMGSVVNLCDRVAWFEHGHLKRLGLPRDVVEEYTGTVQMDRETDENGRTRWGSGEGRIVQIEMLDSSGRPSERFRTGEPMRIRLHYEMYQPIEKPVFRIVVTNLAGVPVTGPTTKDVDCIPDKLDGTGCVDIEIDSLRLLPNTYDLSAILTDRTQYKTFDHRQHAVRFDVERGKIHEDLGFVSLSPRWHVGDLVAGG